MIDNGDLNMVNLVIVNGKNNNEWLGNGYVTIGDNGQ